MIANIFAIIELFLFIHTRFATEEYEQEGSAPVDSCQSTKQIKTRLVSLQVDNYVVF